MREETSGKGLKGGLVRAARTKLKSQARVSFLIEGKVFRRLQRNWAVVGCLKAEKPSIGSRKELSTAR